MSQLSEALSVNLVERIGETIEGLEYLAKNTFRLQLETPDELLRDMQLREKIASDSAFPATEEGWREFFKTFELLRPSYKPPVTMRGFEDWKTKAHALKNQTKPGALMRKFCRHRSTVPQGRDYGKGVSTRTR